LDCHTRLNFVLEGSALAINPDSPVWNPRYGVSVDEECAVHADPRRRDQESGLRLKGEPKQLRTQNNREFLDHLAWLKEHAIGAGIFREIPAVNLKPFAAEARSLDVTAMNDLTWRKDDPHCQRRSDNPTRILTWGA